MKVLRPVSKANRVFQGFLVAAIALTLSLGFNPGGADAQKTVSMKCSGANAAFLWAVDQLDKAQRNGDKTGAAAWTEVAVAIQDVYLGMGCAGGGSLEGLAT